MPRANPQILRARGGLRAEVGAAPRSLAAGHVLWEAYASVAYQAPRTARVSGPHPCAAARAGLCEATHWGYYSCSGFTSDVPGEKRVNHWKGVRPLWDDVAKVHSQVREGRLLGPRE